MPKNSIVPILVVHNNKARWRVIKPRSLGGGKRFFETEKDAKKHCADLERQRMNGSARFAGLTPATQSAVMMALDELGDGNGPKILDAVRHWNKTSARKACTVREVAAECLKAKTDAGCRPAYLTPFELMLDRFAAHCGPILMSDVGLDKVESFVNGPTNKGTPASIYTKRNRKIDLGTLFSFAMHPARGYCQTNLPAAIQEFKIDAKDPGILTPKQAETLLRHCETKARHLLPFAVLCMFGGLRPSEAQRLTWADIHENEIRVAADRGKGRANRFVTINDTLRAWLAACDKGQHLPISEPRSRKVRDILGTDFAWPRDGLRHSFCSYHLAIHGEHLTAKEAGHSADILRQHYRNIVTKQTAVAYFGILPTLHPK